MDKHKDRAATVAAPSETGGYVTHDQAFKNAAAYEPSWPNHQGASEATRNDASGTGASLESGTHQHHEHRSGKADADKHEHHGDSDSAGVRSACELSSAETVAAQQQAEPVADEIACSSCGLTMADSKALAAMKQAKPVGDERAAVATPFLTTQVEGDPDPAKQRFRMVAEYRSLDDMYRGQELFVAAIKAAQSGQRAGVAEKCAQFAELYRDEHACGREAEEACNEIARACREFAAAPTPAAK